VLLNTQAIRTTTALQRPALEFVDEEYDDETVDKIIRTFQKTGCAVL
jgi:hypothetical protein